MLISDYIELIDDPAISCVYIALPNSLHYEWTLRALRAGKHVLLEKPSVSNGTEACKLFRHPLVTAPNAPILLEAFHYRFHPAWQTFLALIHKDPVAGPVQLASSEQYIFKGHLPNDDIRFIYSLSGGCLMDFGAYTVSCLRQILNDARPEVSSTTFRMLRKQDIHQEGQVPEQIDSAVTATYKTRSGAQGRMVADLQTSGGYSWLPSAWTKHWPSMGWPKCVVQLGEKEVESSQANGEQHTVTRKVTMWNHLAPSLYHTIRVEDQHLIRRGSQEIRSWNESKTVKAYDWPNKSDGRVGAEWWPTHRYQLEEFVNRVKGRRGTGVWVDGEDSIAQMDVMDATYENGGLKLRPTSSFSIDM